MIRYGAAIVLVAVFFLLSLGAGVAAGSFEFLILILPVLLASVLYDRGSGFLATGLGVLAMASQLDWQADPVGHLVALTVFAIVALFIAVFCEALRSALERGLTAQQELQLLLQEQRNRVKNDFALLSSMIALQARSQSSPPVRAALESAVARLQRVKITSSLRPAIRSSICRNTLRMFAGGWARRSETSDRLPLEWTPKK